MWLRCPLKRRPRKVGLATLGVHATVGAAGYALLIAWAWSVTHRSELIVEVLRDRNALYRETADSVENDYLLKIANKTMQPQRYRIALVAPDGIALRGAEFDHAFDFGVGDHCALQALDAGSRRRFEEHVASAEQTLGPLAIDDRARINLR